MNELNVSKVILYEEGELNTINYTENEKINKLRIIHFNDVYNIESRRQEPCGGASRFINILNNLINENTLVFFSGDAFSPSNLSNLFKGKQMCEILNHCSINAACLGNHDFDFGKDSLDNLVRECKFPWLLSNVKDSLTNETLCGSLVYHIEHINNLKIGIIGLVEEEWINTLGTIDTDELNYEPFLLSGNRLSLELKEKHSCDLVIALTHMRLPNDLILANKIKHIDLILGGHDHSYYCEYVNNSKWLIKSGCDFRELTCIELNGKKIKKIEKYIVDSLVEENKNISNIINKYLAELDRQLDVILGEVKVDLDGRFDLIRKQETNLGNFICDIILSRVDADCCLLNGGSFRSDTIHPKGQFKIRDLKSILPFEDNLVVIEVTGQKLYEALENGVSQYPTLEGRFPQIGGMRFEFDPYKPCYSRINPSKVEIKDSTLDLNKLYKLCTKKYLFNGKDGYISFKNSKVIIDDEQMPPLFNIVQDYFNTIKLLNEPKESKHRLRASVVPLFIVNHLIRQLSGDPCVIRNNQIVKDDDLTINNDEGTSLKKSRRTLTFKMVSLLILKTLKLQKKVSCCKPIRKAIKQTSEFKTTISLFEEKSKQLTPEVDGRIVILKI